MKFLLSLALLSTLTLACRNESENASPSRNPSVRDISAFQVRDAESIHLDNACNELVIFLENYARTYLSDMEMAIHPDYKQRTCSQDEIRGGRFFALVFSVKKADKEMFFRAGLSVAKKAGTEVLKVTAEPMQVLKSQDGIYFLDYEMPADLKHPIFAAFGEGLFDLEVTIQDWAAKK